ncbi:MAG: tetratricopeptide repeat protein [Acaryochloridaceae cyanobacterium CSU_3_4]|nr:tetratricopeptide repeat protein [Acaryochloridaceae cyanobacterium CSU_3_4]
MTLSLCMIVKNEAANLSRCLQSVVDIVDEQIIVDTGSTDETIAIAQSFAAQIYKYDWQDDFAAARNYGLQYVQSDWVLVLDADEILVPGIIPQLQRVMQEPNTLAVTLLRQEVGAQQSPYSLLCRLFRRHPQMVFKRPYHEVIDESVLAIQAQDPHWQVGYLPEVAIEHLGYQRDAIATRNKHQRARRIMAAALAQDPTDAYLCSKLGALYGEMGEVEEGLVLLEQGLRLKPTEAAIVYELHYHLGHTYGRLGQVQSALQHYQQAVSQDLPDCLKIGAYNNWANLLKQLGHLDQACQLYKHLIACQPDLAMGYYNLGLTLREKGDLGGAISAYQQALEKQPDYADAYQNLGVAFFKQGNLQASQQAFVQAIDLHLQHNNVAEADRLQQGMADLGLPL